MSQQHPAKITALLAACRCRQCELSTSGGDTSRVDSSPDVDVFVTQDPRGRSRLGDYLREWLFWRDIVRLRLERAFFGPWLPAPATPCYDVGITTGAAGLPNQEIEDMMRAKFKVNSVKVADYGNGSTKVHEIEAQPVYRVGPDGTNIENEMFGKYTPSGMLKMTLNNPTAGEFFKAGEEYYLDFSPAAAVDGAVIEALEQPSAQE